MHKLTIDKLWRSLAVGATLSCLLGAGSAHAVLLTTNTLVGPTLDFSQFTGVGEIVNANGPIQVGGLVGEDIEYTGAPNTGLYSYNGGWGLSNNGLWNDGRNGYLGLNAEPGEMILTFNDGPVAGVGGLMNYWSMPNSGQADLIITAYDFGMNVLEQYNVTTLADIVTPSGTNDGAFRGIQRANADIHAFGISGDYPVLDDVVFERQAAVPAPATALLLGTGLASAGFVRRRRKS